MWLTLIGLTLLVVALGIAVANDRRRAGTAGDAVVLGTIFVSVVALYLSGSVS